MWVIAHADNAASCPAGAVTAATQSLAIKLYTYIHFERAGESLPYLDGPVVAHAWPLPEANQPRCFPLLYHTGVS